MKQYFGYARVSTMRQGEHGVSLQEQKDAIEREALKNNLFLGTIFEERKTAASRGRPVFAQMLALIRNGGAQGVIMHKIDRGARNLKDWADLGELLDLGIDVRFAGDPIDLSSRSGRLSADIQAVVAADYIRNLREETRKGFYGRLKQGIYPMPAPLGYLDAGPGKAKVADPERAPLVRLAFELYASGEYGLGRLRNHMDALGLRTKGGQRLSVQTLSTILNNPFYMGMMEIRKTGETFLGEHLPIIPASLFEAVRGSLRGRRHRRNGRFNFLYSRLLRCAQCGRSPVGELKKGHVYYRCHSKTCRMHIIREDRASAQFRDELRQLRMSAEHREHIEAELARKGEDAEIRRLNSIRALKAEAEEKAKALTSLTISYSSGIIEESIYLETKRALIAERLRLDERIEAVARESDENNPRQVRRALEMAAHASHVFDHGSLEEKRSLIREMFTERLLGDHKLMLKPRELPQVTQSPGPAD